MKETLARAAGHSGELVLGRDGDHLEIVCDGSFLISTRNEVSSRALIAAARPFLPAGRTNVLIGGLGVGHALDEALASLAGAAITVVEIEPVVLEWYGRYCGERARRALTEPRVRFVVGDAVEYLGSVRHAFGLVALDTDNGPGWLVRPANAVLYQPAGLRRVRAALRQGGVATFWAADHDARFAECATDVFDEVTAVETADVIDGRTLTFVIYVCHVV